MTGSIISNADKCFICGRRTGLQKHHCWHGTANRKKAEEDGLYVNLCTNCHRELHDYGMYDKLLMQISEGMYIIEHHCSIDDFRNRYGKNVL